MPTNWGYSTIGNISTYGFTVLHRKLAKKELVIELDNIAPHSSLINRQYLNAPFNMNSKIPFQKGMILYSKLRPYLDKVIIADCDGIATSEIVPFYSLIKPEFLGLFFKSPYFLSRVSSLMYGVKMPRLGSEDMRNTLLAIPPEKEQNRIVLKLHSILQEI